MKKYLFYANNPMEDVFDHKLNFEKLGINIRKISAKEYNDINDLLEKTIYLPKLKEYYSDYKNLKNKNVVERLKTLECIANLPKFERVGYSYIRDQEIHGKSVDKDMNDQLLKSLYIIDVNEKANTLFDIKQITILLNKILNFSYFLSKDLYDLFNYTNPVWIIEYDSLFDEELDSDYLYANISVLLDIDKHPTNCDFSKLYQLANLMNDKDTDYNFNYIMTIDSFMSNNGLIENEILNRISIIERILIGKDSEKRSNFILKVGAILINEERDKISIQKLTKRLGAIYDIRSIIAHGNDIKNIDKYSEIFGISIDPKENKTDIRKKILIVASVDLTAYMKCIFNKYITDPQFCEFLKSN